MLDVLFVDDDDKVCRQVSAYLRAAGLSVETRSDTFSAIRRLESTPVLVVVTDEVMRGPSGTSLLETVRRRWPLSGRILYTGLPTPEVQRGALSVGALLLVKGDEDPKNFRHAIIAEVQDAERRHQRPV
jgi:DNA-binding NtrC family response regulator